MSFDHILGHKREIGILRSAILNGRVAHSYLFAGPEGVGKRAVALAFAKALNCEVPSGGEPCESCQSCELFERKAHPNLMEVWPTSKEKDELVKDLDGGLIRIEQIRQVQSALKYKIDGGRKAVIVDRAEKLMPQAANAFLKTLEEPPAGSLIMLVTSRPTELLQTILSRCQRINFKPLPEEELAGYLREQRGAAAKEASAIARLTGGSLARALKYMDEGTNGERKEILKRLSSLETGDVAEALDLADELSKRDDIEELLEFIKCYYRDMAAVASGAGELAVNKDIAGDFSPTGGRTLVDKFTYVENARRSLTAPRYANKQLTMEELLLRLIG